MSLREDIIQFVKEAGSASEASYRRQGFLSQHEETHALGAGLGLGFAIGAFSILSIGGALLTFVVYGKGGDSLLEPKLREDILNERHYFIGGFGLGLFLGMAARVSLRAMGAL